MKEKIRARLLVHHYRYELESWRRLLAYQKEELVYCKNRLAEIINSHAAHGLLLAAETFQEEFLAQERAIEFLTEELKAQFRALEQEELSGDGSVRELGLEQAQLRHAFQKAGELFLYNKNSFVQYLQGLYQAEGFFRQD